MAPEEREAREAFYEDMIWIVDGNRGLDRSYFYLDFDRHPISLKPLGYGLKWWGRSRLLYNWCESQVPVFFDFHEGILWRLGQFSAETRIAVVYPVPVDWVVEDCVLGRAIRAVYAEEQDPWPFRRREFGTGG